MDQKSLGSSSAQIESTPKRTRWDSTPSLKYDLNSNPDGRKIQERTPLRAV